MTEHDLVIGYEMARKLKTAGAPQSSCYYWVGAPDLNVMDAVVLYDLPAAVSCINVNAEDGYKLEMFSAYTLEELGKVIVEPFESGRIDNLFYAALRNEEKIKSSWLWGFETELEARAQLLYRLLVSAGESDGLIRLEACA